MPLTRGTADAVLKEFYLPGIRNTLNYEVFLLSQVEANSEDIEGRRAVLAIRTGRNASIGARAEMGTLPTAGTNIAGQQGYSQEYVPLKYNYGRIMLSGPMMKSMGSDRGSFTRALQSETEGVTRDLKNDVNRQLYGTSNGQIAQLQAAASGNTATLTAATNTPTVMQQLLVGMYVDIGTIASMPAAPSTASQRQITAVNPAAGTFTFSGAAVAIVANDGVFRSGAGGTGGLQQECTGLQTQISNAGVLWNIDPAVVGPQWQSYVDATGGAVSEKAFIKAQQQVMINSGEEVDLWITDAGTHRNVALLLTSLKRFPMSTELKGGYTGLDMTAVGQGRAGGQTVSMVYDKDCPSGVAYAICTKRFQWYRMSDWEFMEEDGAVLARIVGANGQDAYEGTLFCYAELATDGRNAHGVLTGLTYT
jgi:hypothetical protein